MNGDDGTDTFSAVDLDVAAVVFHYMLDNGKSKACAASLPGMAFVYPVEAFKDPFLVLGWYADAGIRYPDDRAVLLFQKPPASHVLVLYCT